MIGYLAHKEGYYCRSMRFLFGISTPPRYFKEIMEKLIRDHQGVAVYMDDILVSGATVQNISRNFVHP